MNRFSQIIGRIQTRQFLIIFAVVLLVLNLSRFLHDHFTQQQEEISSRVALLGQYRMSTLKLAETREKVARLKKQMEKLDGYLISGISEEEIESNLQITLQQQVSMAGMAVESLRPVKRSDKAKDKDKKYGEITIKMRLSGTLNEFIDFIASLYKSKTLYQIESLTLKPYRNKGLKVFLDYKGYYKIVS